MVDTTWQVASRVLEVPMSLILISETATNCVPNSTSTGASVSSDLNGAAVMVLSSLPDAFVIGI